MHASIRTDPSLAILQADTGTAFHCEILKQFLKRAALRARLVEALHDGGADIASAHSTASRNVPMTFWTRLI